jgi:excisionase family DNA binding protein
MNNLPNTQTFLTIQDTAKLLKVSTKTLRRWEAKGTLVPVRTSGGHRRYTLPQVKEYKESLKIKKIKPQISGPVVLPTITTTAVPVNNTAIVNEIKTAHITQLDNSLQTDPFEFVISTQPEPINIRTEEVVLPAKQKSTISARIFASALLLTGLMVISSASGKIGSDLS